MPWFGDFPWVTPAGRSARSPNPRSDLAPSSRTSPAPSGLRSSRPTPTNRSSSSSAMSLESRKHQELTLKLASIREDLEAWRKASAEHGPYEKHNSQIARLATRLEAAQKALEEQLETAQKNGTVLST